MDEITLAVLANLAPRLQWPSLTTLLAVTLVTLEGSWASVLCPCTWGFSSKFTFYVFAFLVLFTSIGTEVIIGLIVYRLCKNYLYGDGRR